MNITADRVHGEQIRVTLWLDDEEARKLANTLRELCGDALPPARPAPWQPLTASAPAPLPSAAIRAEIQEKLGRKKPCPPPSPERKP